MEEYFDAGKFCSLSACAVVYPNHVCVTWYSVSRMVDTQLEQGVAELKSELMKVITTAFLS